MKYKKIISIFLSLIILVGCKSIEETEVRESIHTDLPTITLTDEEIKDNLYYYAKIYTIESYFIEHEYYSLYRKFIDKDNIYIGDQIPFYKVVDDKVINCTTSPYYYPLISNGLLFGITLIHVGPNSQRPFLYGGPEYWLLDDLTDEQIAAEFIEEPFFSIPSNYREEMQRAGKYDILKDINRKYLVLEINEEKYVVCEDFTYEISSKSLVEDNEYTKEARKILSELPKARMSKLDINMELKYNGVHVIKNQLSSEEEDLLKQRILEINKRNITKVLNRYNTWKVVVNIDLSISVIQDSYIGYFPAVKNKKYKGLIRAYYEGEKTKGEYLISSSDQGDDYFFRINSKKWNEIFKNNKETIVLRQSFKTHGNTPIGFVLDEDILINNTPAENQIIFNLAKEAIENSK